MFCCTFLFVPSSFAIILMGKIDLVALLSLPSWRLVIIVWLCLAVPWVGLQFVIVVFPDHTHFFGSKGYGWQDLHRKPVCISTYKIKVS